MADTPANGCRDGLRIDSSRCLKMRFCDSACRRCADLCPHGAVTLDGGLVIDAERCNSCLLCTSVCPSGALEQGGDFSSLLARLAAVPAPVLGCSRTKERSHAFLACLGGLSEEHLLALCHSLAGELTLNLTSCGQCPNNAMVDKLRQRLAVLSGRGLLEGGGRIGIVESAEDIHFRDESIDRRGFFKSLRSSLFHGAAVILSAGMEQPERRADYSVKRVPARRELLNLAMEKLPPDVAAVVRNYFDFGITFADNCAACRGCVAICPAGALLTDSPDDPPGFDPTRCTGCALCVEFCLDGAVKLTWM